MPRPNRSTALLQIAARAAKVGLWSWDLRTNAVTFSAEWKRQLGYAEDEIAHEFHEWESRVHPDDLPRLKELLADYVAKPWPNYEAKFRLRHKDGSWRWILTQADVAKDRQGRPRQMTGSHIDITEHMRVEAELRSANRALQMLSDSNQALIRITDETSLLNEICRIVVEVGGYRLAWVGFAEPDGAVRTAAHRGFPAGQPGTPDPTGADGPRGRDPIGTAIRTGRPVILHDIPAGPADGLSLIALPLSADARTVGALAIYSSDPAAFDAAEVRILGELAGDLAFGLHILHMRAERDRVQTALKESERLYRSVVTTMAEGLCLQAADGRILAINPAAERIEGRSRAEMTGLTSDDPRWGAIREDGSPFPGPEHPAMVTLRSGRPQKDVIMGIHQPDGSPKWISINSEPLVATAGEKPYAVVTTFHDITARRQAESALKTVLRNARTIVMHYLVRAPAGWEGCRADWAAANFRWEAQMFDEATAQEVLPVEVPPGRRYDSGWGAGKHPDDLGPMGLTAHQAILSGAPLWRQEFRVTDRHGRLHWMSQVASIEPAGPGCWRITTTNTDITGRKLAEAALHAREEEFRALAENTPDPICRFDRDCRFIYSNPAHEKLVGALLPALRGKTPLEVYPPVPSVQFFQQKVREALASGEPSAFEITLDALADGNPECHSIRLAPERDRDGRVTSVLCVGRDITPLKQIEGQLRALADHSPDAICRFDRHCRIAYVNPAYERLIGLPSDRMLGRTPREIHPDHPGVTDYENRVRQVIATATAVEYETVLGALPGPPHPHYNLRLLPESDRTGQVASVLCVGRDISVLKETERQLRTLVEHSPDIILRFDRAGRYLFVNHAMETVTGIPAAEFIGRPIGEIAALRRGPAVAEKFRLLGQSVARVFASGQTAEEEMRLPMAAGELVFNLRLIPETDETGQVATVLTIAREITARQHAEEALRASMARVVQHEAALIALTKHAPLQGDDLIPALRRLTESSARALGVARVSLWRYQPGGQTIRCVDLFELASDRHSEGTELAAADYPEYFRALAESDVIAADDARTERRTAEFTTGYLEPLGITSMMDVPIQLKGRPDGVLCHEHIGPPRRWTSDERTFALAIANLTTLVLEEWQRKQAQEELRQSQQAYVSLVNTVDGIVWEMDVPTFRFTFVSQQAERLLGHPVRRWLDEPTFWQDHLHPDDRGWAVDFCLTATREKRDHDFKYRMLAADGRVVWLHDLVTVVIEHDRPAKLRGLIVDITEAKRAEEALLSSEQRFRQVTDNIDEVFWLTDPAKSEMIYISPAYQRVWGRTCDSLYAQPQSWLEAIHPDDRPRVRSAALTLQTTGGYNLEYRIVRPDETVRWIRDRAFPIRDADGRVFRIAGVAEDITAKHQLEDQLRQTQKMESLGTLAGGIAHDFNNILTGVLGSAEVARLELPANHPASPWIHNITVAGHRARDLVQQILTFGRKHESELAPRKLQLVLAEALHLLRSTIPSMVQIEARIDDTCPPVIADDTQIHQVVMNLCTNAWHALPEQGGRIDISLAPIQVTAAMTVTRLGLAAGPHVLLTVRDNGRGMPPEILARIFEPFFTTKQQGQGTGLGLAVVHGIVQSHHGAIFARSSPGRGTFFEIFLPALQAEPATAAAAGDESLAHGRGERILLIDDDATALAGLRGQLEYLGYRVIALPGSRAALKHFFAAPGEVDLIMTDYAMPDYTGQELIAKVLALRPGFPVILTSGFIDPQQLERIRALGVRDFVRKPVPLAELARVVARHLRRD